MILSGDPTVSIITFLQGKPRPLDMYELAPLELRTESLSAIRKSQSTRDGSGRFVESSKSYEWLLNDPLITVWIDGYTSAETREKKLYQLEKVLKAGGFSRPADFLRMSDRDTKLLTRRVVNWYLQHGKGVWAKQVLMTVKGFLEAHDRSLEFKRSERIRTPPRKKVSVEYVPNRTDAYKLADSAGSNRNKALILCLFQSGVRVSCLCNWSYGTLADQLFPEPRRPVRIRVTPGMDTKLSLYGLAYYVTGLSTEAALAVRDYVGDRKNRGWLPASSDPLFVSERNGQVSRMRRENVWLIVKNAARKAKIDPKTVWVHCLRKSFRKVLNAAPQIDEDTKEALMGHKLPGSRGNYFDYHDEDEVMGKYMHANFSRNG